MKRLFVMYKNVTSSLSDYRGNVMVLLFNFGDAAFNVARGDRIAQLVLEKICMAELEELPTLDDTERGDGGFGSTGKN